MSNTVSHQLSPRDISGLWVQGIDEQPDATLGDVATHGTFTRSVYLRLVCPEGDPNAVPGDGATGITSADLAADFHVLYVFNEAAELALFVWRDDHAMVGGRSGAWVSSNGWVTFRGDKSSLGKEMNIRVAPNLALRSPEDHQVPPGYKDTGCPMAFGTATIDRDVQPVAAGTIAPSGALNIGMPLEYIAIHRTNPSYLSWYQRNAAGDDVIEITLTPADVMQHDNPGAQPDKADKPDKADTWDDVFKSSSYPQNDAVFVGYKPDAIDLYSGALSGTYAEVFDRQELSGRRIFGYPLRSSTDFAKSRGGEGKYLPLGTVYVPITSGTDASSDLTISTENQQCFSAASTYGLKGGIDDTLKASLSVSREDKTERTNNVDYRYTASTETSKRYALNRHLPNLALEDSYLRELRDKLELLLSDNDLKVPDLEWNALEGTWGSHYANAVTFGTVKSLKTVLSEKTEGVLVEQGTKLNVAAKGAFDKFSVGGNADVAKTWGDEFKESIGTKDVSDRYVGVSDAPAPIFLDLRPANELLNPILVPWAPGANATNDQQQAPFIWYVLRRSWLDYQRRHHLFDKAISALPDVDYSPKIVKIGLKVSATVQSAFDWPSLFGDITWEAYGGAIVAGCSEYHRSSDAAQRSENGATLPGTDNLSCTLVASQTDYESGAGVWARLRLKNWHIGDSQDFYNGDAQIPMKPDKENTFSAMFNSVEQTGYLTVTFGNLRQIIVPSV